MIPINEKREALPMLAYYQAQSEIDDVTSKHASYEMYFSKETCQKKFPDSGIAEMREGDIEDPLFVDIPTFGATSRGFVEALCHASEQYFDSLGYIDENDHQILDSDYILCVVKNDKSFDKGKQILTAWLNHVDAGDVDDELDQFLLFVLASNAEYVAVCWRAE